MNSENCHKFIVLKFNKLQTIIAIIAEDKVTKLFCMTDDFYQSMSSKKLNLVITLFYHVVHVTNHLFVI